MVTPTGIRKTVDGLRDGSAGKKVAVQVPQAVRKPDSQGQYQSEQRISFDVRGACRGSGPSISGKGAN